MRGINNIKESFNDEEFSKLKEKKGDLSWRDFILTLVYKKNGEDNRSENQ